MNDTSWEHKGTVIAMMIVGIVALAVGLLIASWGWPRMEAGDQLGWNGRPKMEETGNMVLVVLGAVIAATGQLMVTIGTIATGVRLGR